MYMHVNVEKQEHITPAFMQINMGTTYSSNYIMPFSYGLQMAQMSNYGRGIP